MSEEDRRVVSEALRAAIDGPFIDDELDFTNILGFSRAEARSILTAWPAAVDELATWTLVITVLSTLATVGAPEEVWWEFISVPVEAVREVDARLRAAGDLDAHLISLRRQALAPHVRKLSDEHLRAHLRLDRRGGRDHVIFHEEVVREAERRHLDEDGRAE